MLGLFSEGVIIEGNFAFQNGLGKNSLKLVNTKTTALRPIYTVQLCRIRYAYDKSTTQIVSCKSILQLACDCRVRHEECRGLLKHVLKPYDNRSDGQFCIVEIVYHFSMTRAARAIKIACDNGKIVPCKSVLKQLTLTVHGLIFGRIFASEIWGAYFREGFFLGGLIIGIVRCCCRLNFVLQTIKNMTAPQ